MQVVLEYERAVIFRLGRLLPGGAKGPGKTSARGGYMSLCQYLKPSFCPSILLLLPKSVHLLVYPSISINISISPSVICPYVHKSVKISNFPFVSLSICQFFNILINQSVTLSNPYMSLLRSHYVAVTE